MSQNTRSKVKVRPALFPADKEAVSKLFLAYAHSLPISLDFQNFEHELAELPGKYGVENGGAVFLAYTPLEAHTNGPEEEQVIGCIALRSFSSSNSIPTCELKRLYLAPESRGRGVSKLLLDMAIQQARVLGYKEILLDTLSSMTAARALYMRYGFEEIESYYESVEGAVFYRLVL
ncbi:acyl-CoA N-acyltransferase [Cucurbitaria berberidis CBS 394.84]|uniref:Acyl-CoA N-acyltransferase n=1 Tax=Cucurbitaria berberidis CBS 394.84 TaxID=1168544 RepID=A0A9P4GRY4_9PLEO|nr:acyl-CoA N-acyltransferase [Cucurbitaria berberidis CBS 394.84]KAF1850650.1 acyl-CoA N-acyltransferase [Cucurbitaria berberidis CBS 394.84]